ncbi:tyrosine-type recombinase/integrase [Thiothrix subterranea]|uniref:Integrase arm-type DNA-binding domain-containing protein n=1 Tax=Thiothrix subterranea TaxID=2735563 RepID=A0AA51R6C7_9GAMM|nr:integrase arm-type DNA-binding domain-containing protein [Thiothrix subterranea]MDQ5767349.1 integrase arm-type DNA-binding domain-containing protein [Thiothrix subterranea]WML88790.1 integrase arm-type DNA-binding domain-containing protein [Thiothrix subterranea]
MKRSLNDTAVKNAKPKDKEYKLSDGGGLYLLVKPNGSKLWRYKYKLPKEKVLAIGSYPEISLKDARLLHEEARALWARGVDPSQHKQATKGAKRAESANTFQAIATEWLVKFTADQAPEHTDRQKRRLERHVFPWIGGRIIGEIEPPDILAVLRRIEAAGTLETAHRVKTIIGQVFRYAVATGRAVRDQTADLKGALPPAKGNHFAAITDPKEIGALLRAMAGYRGAIETRIALQLSAYLFTRPGELRQMEWAEIEGDVWTIPAEKMKAGRVHVVPLCKQALALLEEMRPLTGKRRYVFPSRTDTKKPMSANTVRSALVRLGYESDTMTAHGFRALASTRLYEMGFHSELIERQLAHTVGNEVRRAYDRSQHLDQRTAMMQQWADYLDSLRDGAQVIPIRRATS